MVAQETLTVGELTSFFLYTAYVGSSMIGISSWYSELMKGVGASTRLFQLLEEKNPIESSQGSIIPNEKLNGRIDFNMVRFSYPTRSNTLIFNNLCFSVNPGENVGTVFIS